MCSLNDYFLSRVNPRCFWFELNLISDLLKKSSRCVVAFFFLEKIISCASLVWSGLNYIFHWYAQSCNFNRSLLIVETDVFIQFTILNKELSSAKSLILEFNPCGWPKKRGPNTDPCGTSANNIINSQLENWPFKTTLWCLLWRNDSSIEEHSFYTIVFNSLYKRLSC